MDNNVEKCCTAALAVYLLLFSASYYLYSPSTASGERYRSTNRGRNRAVFERICETNR